jgi:hypothetical protein
MAEVIAARYPDRTVHVVRDAAYATPARRVVLPVLLVWFGQRSSFVRLKNGSVAARRLTQLRTRYERIHRKSARAASLRWAVP